MGACGGGLRNLAGGAPGRFRCLVVEGNRANRDEEIRRSENQPGNGAQGGPEGSGGLSPAGTAGSGPEAVRQSNATPPEGDPTSAGKPRGSFSAGQGLLARPETGRSRGEA